ncbi:hypothetical protein CYMTET_2489 [Cymbomonas tetramitiformis]|uniref:Uncharacterized protein n=1 Tax=Cymbomonas tetramitiformis TaxID=36881 RepID=A0AAE0LLR2_9CHLO|nr:hypothetical protein CYMTET_2489 [Cymbomonas tetramitiformis]
MLDKGNDPTSGVLRMDVHGTSVNSIHELQGNINKYYDFTITDLDAALSSPTAYDIGPGNVHYVYMVAHDVTHSLLTTVFAGKGQIPPDTITAAPSTGFDFTCVSDISSTTMNDFGNVTQIGDGTGDYGATNGQIKLDRVKVETTSYSAASAAYGYAFSYTDDQATSSDIETKLTTDAHFVSSVTQASGVQQDGVYNGSVYYDSPHEFQNVTIKGVIDVEGNLYDHYRVQSANIVSFAAEETTPTGTFDPDKLQTSTDLPGGGDPVDMKNIRNLHNDPLGNYGVLPGTSHGEYGLQYDSENSVVKVNAASAYNSTNNYDFAVGVYDSLLTDTDIKTHMEGQLDGTAAINEYYYGRYLNPKKTVRMIGSVTEGIKNDNTHSFSQYRTDSTSRVGGTGPNSCIRTPDSSSGRDGMYNLRIYNGTLSQEDVTKLYNEEALINATLFSDIVPSVSYKVILSIKDLTDLTFKHYIEQVSGSLAAVIDIEIGGLTVIDNVGLKDKPKGASATFDVTNNSGTSETLQGQTVISTALSSDGYDYALSGANKLPYDASISCDGNSYQLNTPSAGLGTDEKTIADSSTETFNCQNIPVVDCKNNAYPPYTVNAANAYHFVAKHGELKANIQGPMEIGEGKISDMIVFNKELTESEIAELYNLYSTNGFSSSTYVDSKPFPYPHIQHAGVQHFKDHKSLAIQASLYNPKGNILEYFLAAFSSEQTDTNLNDFFYGQTLTPLSSVKAGGETKDNEIIYNKLNNYDIKTNPVVDRYEVHEIVRNRYTHYIDGDATCLQKVYNTSTNSFHTIDSYLETKDQFFVYLLANVDSDEANITGKKGEQSIYTAGHVYVKDTKNATVTDTERYGGLSSTSVGPYDVFKDDYFTLASGYDKIGDLDQATNDLAIRVQDTIYNSTDTSGRSLACIKNMDVYPSYYVTTKELSDYTSPAGIHNLTVTMRGYDASMNYDSTKEYVNPLGNIQAGVSGAYGVVGYESNDIYVPAGFDELYTSNDLRIYDADDPPKLVKPWQVNKVCVYAFAELVDPWRTILKGQTNANNYGSYKGSLNLTADKIFKRAFVSSTTYNIDGNVASTDQSHAVYNAEGAAGQIGDYYDGNVHTGQTYTEMDFKNIFETYKVGGTALNQLTTAVQGTQNETMFVYRKADATDKYAIEPAVVKQFHTEFADDVTAITNYINVDQAVAGTGDGISDITGNLATGDIINSTLYMYAYANVENYDGNGVYVISRPLAVPSVYPLKPQDYEVGHADGLIAWRVFIW